MKLSKKELLSRLGDGASIASVCEAAGLSAEEFSAWWKQETKSRVPQNAGTRKLAVTGPVRITRDEWGIPHVFAQNDEDLFFGFGYATAQDRLFQIDYLRRKAAGRLSEILGTEGLEPDLVARTVGLQRIAAAEWQSLPEETRKLVSAFSRGINAVIDEAGDNLPIEFDLLSYRPEPWRPQDCLAIEGEFRWYLTGRFPVIVIPELAKRKLGTGLLFKAFMQPEADHECIMPSGSYTPKAGSSQPAGVTVGDPQEGLGSNNWVVSGAHSTSGKPMVASDPHIAFAAVSCWHEIHLCGGSFNVAGIAYAGMPAVMFGRNPQVAWGITNNICSLRDLYQEKTDPAHPNCFLYDGKWEPAREIAEVIQVKGREPVHKTIRFSHNGPIVDEILPPVAKGTGTVSLRWQGADTCGWLTSLLKMDRSKNVNEFRSAIKKWLVPTFSLVFADVEGHIGYQCSGETPIRNVPERGYRPGWDPAHQWAGLIPFDKMAALSDPERGWITSANNRVAPNDFPFPLAGTWTNGHRAIRIRELLESQPKFSREDFVRMHQDAKSVRAADYVPRLIRVLSKNADPRTYSAINILSGWDYHMETDRVGATLFDVFFTQWSKVVAEQRFDKETVAFLSGAIGGLAGQLLEEDPSGWFENADREETIRKVFDGVLDDLTRRFGPDMLHWNWGRVHTIQQKHFLTTRGELGKLLDRGGLPVKGNGVTVCNTGADPNWGALMGAGYRLIADLADPQGGLWAVDAGGESGHPGSPHYDDQLNEWITAQYHYLPLTSNSETTQKKETTLTLEPC